MIKFVAFDLDDTLYDHSIFEYESYKIIAERLSYDYSFDSDRCFSVMKDLFISGVKEQFFDKVFLNLRDELPEEWDNYVINSILPLYRNFTYKGTLTPFPGVVDLLNDILNCGLKLVLITNGRVRIQNEKIDALGIQDFFHKIFISDGFDPPVRKPNKKIFINVMEELNCSNEEILYIGDNWEIDGSCMSCGIKFVHVSEMTKLKEILGI